MVVNYKNHSKVFLPKNVKNIHFFQMKQLNSHLNQDTFIILGFTTTTFVNFEFYEFSSTVVLETIIQSDSNSLIFKMYFSLY